MNCRGEAQEAFGDAFGELMLQEDADGTQGDGGRCRRLFLVCEELRS